MLQILYRASFFLYELSFLALAVALGIQSLLMRRLTLAIRLPPYWLACAASAGLLLVCAVIHFYVYYFLSPQYLLSGARAELLWMYTLKTVSMGSIFLAGAALLAGAGAYLRSTTR
jgi:hypothetical protein